MKIENNPTITLSREAIEQAIKEYIDSFISEKLYKNGTKVSFTLENTIEDDGMTPYSPIYKLKEAKVSLEFLA